MLADSLVGIDLLNTFQQRLGDPSRSINILNVVLEKGHWGPQTVSTQLSRRVVKKKHTFTFFFEEKKIYLR